jgi:prepilin-type N-terminal cleavage/methylation domain-containing protein
MSGQRGFTLAELLAGLAVMGLVLAGVFTLQRQGTLVYLVGAGRVEAQQNTRLAVEMLSRELRSAQSMTSTANCGSGSTDISFVDQDGRAIRYFREDERLRRRVDGVTTTLFRGLEFVQFRCYAADGTTTTSTAASVRSIVITVHAEPEDAGSNYSPTHQRAQAVSRVRLRNVL